MPASRPALGPQLLFQVLVLTLQAVVLAMHAAVVAVYVFVARQFVTQSRELPVLLLDDNVPSIPLGRGLFQDGEYAAQQAHAPVLSAPRIKTFTPTCGFFARIRRTPLNEDVRNSIVSAVPTHWDTRCGWSCALLNLAAATALRGGSITGDELLNACLDGVQASLPELQQYGYGAHGVAAVHHPPVAHEHAIEVGPQDRLRVVESAAGADGVDGRRWGDGRPQPASARTCPRLGVLSLW